MCHNISLSKYEFSPQFITDLTNQQGDIPLHMEFQEILRRRCQTMLELHHEYRQLQEEKANLLVLQDISVNVIKATSFFLVYLTVINSEMKEEILLPEDNSKKSKVGVL